MTQTLRFLSKGSAMVPNYAHQAAGIRSFVGYKHDSEIGPMVPQQDPLTGEWEGPARPAGGFVRQVGDAFECESTSRFAIEYVRHCRVDNDLWPADVATARFCGVDFVEGFAGEHSDEAKAKAAVDYAAARAMNETRVPAQAGGETVPVAKRK